MKRSDREYFDSKFAELAFFMQQLALGHQRLESHIQILQIGDMIMTREMDELEAEVRQNSEVTTSALALIDGLVDRLQAAGTDKAKLTALTAEIKQKRTQLAEAVAVNTVADEETEAPEGGQQT